MNEFVLNRIKGQKIEHKISNEINSIPIITVKIPEAISPEELQSSLENLFVVETPKSEVLPTIVKNNDNHEFPDLFHFVEWYLQHKNRFSSQQQIPLNTLVEAKDLINVGCACRRTQRLNSANNYFEIFFNNNTKNDLLPTILNILQVKSITFGNFLKFP